MSTIRHFRPVLALLALLLGPGALGPWLQLAHACPTLAPARAEVVGMGGMDMEGMAHHHHPGAPGQPTDENHPCTCIGACQLVVVVAPQATVVPVAVVVAAPRAIFLPGTAPDLVHLTQLHPPATAPPVFA
ncbi:MAG: hypothetical protein IPK12_23165 [Gemmatimonadetes bacterium]|nr:hypothetical protein [Gemmatimonadota bacterium]